jgi:DNA-binding transcriptional LysR family regulator
MRISRLVCSTFIRPSSRHRSAISFGLLSCGKKGRLIAAALRDGHTGILKAAAPAQFMESFLPKFLGIYCQRFPRVDLRLTQDIAPRLLERLARGQLHVVIGIDEPADFHRFDWQLLCPVSILALVSRRHKLADRTTLSIAELRDQPMLLLETGMFAPRSSTMRVSLRRWRSPLFLRAAGLTLSLHWRGQATGLRLFLRR